MLTRFLSLMTCRPCPRHPLRVLRGNHEAPHCVLATTHACDAVLLSRAVSSFCRAAHHIADTARDSTRQCYVRTRYRPYVTRGDQLYCISFYNSTPHLVALLLWHSLYIDSSSSPTIRSLVLFPLSNTPRFLLYYIICIV